MTSSRFVAGCNFLGLHTNESIIQLRQGIESGSLNVILPRFRAVSLPLIRLPQTIKVTRILVVGLLKFRDGGVVILFRKSNPPRQFMSLLHLQLILRRLGAFAEFFRTRFCRRVVLLPDGQPSLVEVVQKGRVVLDLLRETRALDYLK